MQNINVLVYMHDLITQRFPTGVSRRALGVPPISDLTSIYQLLKFGLPSNRSITKEVCRKSKKVTSTNQFIFELILALKMCLKKHENQNVLVFTQLKYKCGNLFGNTASNDFPLINVADLQIQMSLLGGHRTYFLSRDFFFVFNDNLT